MARRPLSRFNPAQPGAAGMKVVATGLLVVMAAIFVVARLLEPAYPAASWVKAFAEAGMVGGMADWFAVTALFRHPLGLPIPHTAIIPRNKDRIGESLATFLKENFLIAPVVARRMRNIDLAGAAGMKVVATGLLVVMAAIFVVARLLEPAYPAASWVKAFAEAGMVGGMADWFAVTALFRHPLGLPIPHTAIIPRNKDRIGESLATFLKENFLIAPVVARRMRHIDLAGAAGRFLQAPAGEETRIRRGASRLIGDLAESLGDERLGGLVKTAISSRLQAMEVAPLLGHALASAINEERHVPMLEAAIRWMARALDANEPLIREMVHKRANWILKLAGIDSRIADSVVDGLRKLTVEMGTDPAHPVRVKIEQALAQLANDLQTNADTRARVEAMKDELLANQSVGLWLDTLWQKGRAALIRAARNPDAAMAGKLGEVIKSVGNSLEGDPRLRRAINQFARRAVAGMAASYGGSIVKLVSETVRGWDARTVTDRLESAVGRDLQYIRINGTLVGGSVGLLLHLFDRL